MSDAFRQKVIRTLIDEIGLLSGGRFEQFGYTILRAIHPAQWTERGTTVEGAPRGYTVDTSAEGASLVGEMSSAVDYFHGSLAKPNNDLLHAITSHPDVKRIWLLSNREATSGETTECANLVTAFVNVHPSIAQVEILDARRIAEHIFTNLDSERFVNALTSYLPSIGRLSDENAFSHRIPVYAGYLSRPSIESAAIDRLSNASYVVLSGISGIGKSALAARLASMLRADFDIIIWLDARELTDVSQLSDIDARRIGTRHNISSLLRRYKCLLVLDDTELSPNQVAAMDCGHSKVILTCQTSSDSSAIMLGDLDHDSARLLLNAGIAQVCPDAVLQRVLASVGGHPLLLVALNRLAQDEGWDAVDACCEGAVDSIEDERHNKVCQRILLRHRVALDKELSFVKWCETSRFDANLASICVSSRAVKNLQKRAFLAATLAGAVRVHDVVYQSIHAVIQVQPEHGAQFRDKLDRFICTEGEHEEAILRRIAHLHAPLLQRLLTADQRASFVYAVALARSGDTPIDLFSDPVSIAQVVAAYRQWTGREIEVRAIIEAVEALFTLTSAKSGADVARQSLQRNIQALELLRTSSAARGGLLTDLRHHYAKMLERLGKLEEAEVEFRSILAEQPAFSAGRLQLARILAKTKRMPEALEECEKLLTQSDVTERAASATILLETLRLLPTVGAPSDVKKYETLIMSALARARDLDRAIAFRLIASVAQKTWFLLPELVLRMFDSIEWRDSVLASDSERFDWAQAHKQAAKVTAVKDGRRREFLVAAADVYRSIRTPNSYQRVQHAEALILLERFDDANAQLEQVDEGRRDSFWWQRKAQVLLGLNKADVALSAINEALSHLKDQKYKAAFLHDRSKIKRSILDTSAREDLQAAINLLPTDDKYRKQLEAELTESDWRS